MRKREIFFPRQLKYLSDSKIESIVADALKEDVGNGDITSSILSSSDRIVKAIVIAKTGGVLCGLKVFEKVYRTIDPEIKIDFKNNEGELVNPMTKVADITGRASSITIGERVALNFLMFMSGIATRVNHLVKRIKKYPTKILDTRKTIPGLREIQKYAVAIGGGYNHRMGLYDMVLIKENHISAIGGIERAVKLAREKYANVPIEVEVSNIKEVREALRTDVDIIMLDNFDNALVKKALSILKGRKYVEISGNVDEKRLVELAAMGVDFVSMGSLTHTVKPMDLSLLIIA